VSSSGSIEEARHWMLDSSQSCPLMSFHDFCFFDQNQLRSNRLSRTLSTGIQATHRLNPNIIRRPLGTNIQTKRSPKSAVELGSKFKAPARHPNKPYPRWGQNKQSSRLILVRLSCTRRPNCMSPLNADRSDAWTRCDWTIRPCSESVGANMEHTLAAAASKSWRSGRHVYSYSLLDYAS
jgi:hypothetical protein